MRASIRSSHSFDARLHERKWRRESVSQRPLSLSAAVPLYGHCAAAALTDRACVYVSECVWVYFWHERA